MWTQIRRVVSKYTAVTLVNLQNQFAYIWEVIGRSFFIVLIMFVFVQLWTAVYQTRDTNQIAGLTLGHTIWYFLLAEMMELSKPRHDQTITAEVKDGSIAYTLVRPYHYLAYHFFNGLGETAVRMSMVLLLGLPVVLYYAGPPHTAWFHLPAILLIMLLSILLDFCVFSIIGLLAFVTEDTNSFRLIYQKLVFILGGLMIPLDFLPDWLQRIARILPFQLTTYAPARLFVSFAATQFWQTLGSQLLWLVLLGGLLTWQYRWAVRHLAINGG